MRQGSLFEDGGTPPGPVPLSPAELSRRIGLGFPPTPEQCHAIQAPLLPHLVVAGAGSGKTQTMGLRVLWLVANGLVEPHRVLGLTFTRKAAAELGERVRRMLRRLQQAHEHDPFLTEQVAASLRTGEPVVTTYHSYAAGLVGEHALRIGLEPDTRLVGEAVSWQYAAQVVESYDGAMESVAYTVGTVVGDVLALAGELSEHLREPGEVTALTARVLAHLEALPRAEGQRTSGHYQSVRDVLLALQARVELLPMVEAYTRLKRSKGVMDHGDQVAVAARLAREHPEVAQVERSRFAAVLLDEYQDTGEAQRVLLTELFGRGHAVTAVGDPRQSIYGWRGASAGNLERFGADFAGDRPAGQSGLTVSFRNGEQILGAANVMAGGIAVAGLADAPLTPGPGRAGAGRVVVALHETVADEAAWVAERVAALGSPDGGRLPWGQIAVLARRRSHFPRLDAELRARGVPCEVVGLGGLLGRPEVVDVVSTLRVLADPAAGAALLRLLTGPRWRLGPRDLEALGRRAREIALTRGLRPASGPGGAQATRQPPPVAVEPDFDAVDERSLVDALDDLDDRDDLDDLDDLGPGGTPAAFSTEGHRRLVLLRDELRRLRRRTSSSLPDLVTAVVRALDLDLELASRPGVRATDALLDVERLVQVAEEFAAAGESTGLPAFLAYLDTATERERGLEVELAEPDGERVQIMTVHAAKGLEWDAVFVAGLTETVFPVEGRPVADWTKQLAALPFELRGDRGELPVFDWSGAADQTGARDALVEFREACRARGALEERRLAYVAMTRARDVLVCSGYWWDTGVKPRGPSQLLDEVHQMAAAGNGTVAVWAPRPEEASSNPMATEPPSGMWPTDPLGSRRPAVEAAARLVRAAVGPRAGAHLSGGSAADRRRADAWDVELELLPAELARSRGRGSGHVVELPSRLSVSQLVALRADPAQLARSLRRPLPQRPAPQARRGTRFHLWLEQLWGQQRLLDVDEMPGAADETAEPDADLVALQQAFRASDWWSRAPAEVEFPFDMLVEGVVLRGRCDAVFADAPDGVVDIVDWKTGSPKSGAAAEAAAVQLAVYRLAWHHLSGVPLEQIRAAFHHVGANRTIRPADLLDHDGIVALVRSVPTVAD